MSQKHGTSLSSINTTMKTRTVRIILLAIAFAKSIYAQETRNYEISEDKTIIKVWGDCTIKVEEFAPDNIEIYGNLGNGGIWQNGKVDGFKSQSRTLNPGVQGVSFKKDPLNKNGFAQIEIKCSELVVDSLDVKFYAAKWYNNDWYADSANTFKTTIIKVDREENGVGKEQISSGEEDKVATAESQSENESEKIEHTQSELQGYRDVYNGLKKWLVVLCIACVCLVGIIILLLKKLRDSNRKQKSQQQDEMRKVGADSKQTGSVEREFREMKDFLDAQLKNMKGEIAKVNDGIDGLKSQMGGMLNSLSILSIRLQNQANTQNYPISPEENAKIDTDNVIYDPNTNSFTIGETNVRVFRIYCKEGNYYYTLVNDDNIRREIIGALRAFEKCLTVQPSQVGSKLVPVDDGLLIKNGNTFFVDPNHKLNAQLQ